MVYPVALIKNAVGIGVCAIALPERQLVNHLRHVCLGLLPGGAPGPLEVVGCYPGQRIEPHLSRVRVVSPGAAIRAPAVGKRVGGGPVRVQVGPGILCDAAQKSVIWFKRAVVHPCRFTYRSRPGVLRRTWAWLVQKKGRHQKDPRQMPEPPHAIT
jgi:hypothetical protein